MKPVTHLVLSRNPKPGLDKIQLSIPPSDYDRVIIIQLASMSAGKPDVPSAKIGIHAEQDVTISRMEMIDDQEQAAKAESIKNGVPARRSLNYDQRRNNKR